MSIRQGSFTSESVSAGHPDKVCDRISDAVLDRFLSLDPGARVACETLAADGKIVVAGEFGTVERGHFDTVQEGAVNLVRETLCDVGYGASDRDIDPQRCAIEVWFNHQSEEIAAGLGDEAVLGAGDQGMMFGYATRETPALTPLAWTLATDLVERATRLRRVGGTPLRADGKSQVTVRYADGAPVGVQAVVLSWQHEPGIDITEIRRYLEREIVDAIVPRGVRTPEFRLYCNPAGSWTIGGPKGDTGLTGRKIIVDTYGGSCPHGGGAFSGKDPSKVDRSGAYAARWVAKHIVAAGLACRCTVQIAYAIGVAEPVSIAIDTHDDDAVGAAAIERAVREVFDLSPTGIIRDLELRRPIYAATAALGHFGRWRDPAVYRWEQTDRVDALRCAYLHQGGRLPREAVARTQRFPVFEWER